jgi:NADH-quinone oxidoreductase subunit L
MILSVVVALAGIGLAYYFFMKNRAAADKMAANFSGVHRVLENKYYLDEIYDTAVVQPVLIVSEDGLWKGVDIGVIDRTVNGVAKFVGGTSEILRLFQTGSVRAYAASVFFGVVLVLGYYLWR